MDPPVFDADGAAPFQFLEGAGNHLSDGSQLSRELFLGPVRARLVCRQFTDQARQPVRDLIKRHLADHAHQPAQILAKIGQHLSREIRMRLDERTQSLVLDDPDFRLLQRFHVDGVRAAIECGNLIAGLPPPAIHG